MKKIICLFIALITVMAIVACGNEGGGNNSKNENSANKNSTSAIYHDNGNLHYVASYDEENRLTKIEYFDEYGNITRYHVYEYRESIICATLYQNNVKKRYAEYTDDENELILKEKNYNDKGELSSCYTYEYNENNFKLKESSFDAEDNLEWYKAYEYGANYNGDTNREHIVTWYRGDGTRESKLYTNALGDTIKREYFDESDKLTKCEITEYNSISLVISKVSTYDGEGNLIYVVEYDENGIPKN